MERVLIKAKFKLENLHFKTMLRVCLIYCLIVAPFLVVMYFLEQDFLKIDLNWSLFILSTFMAPGLIFILFYGKYKDVFSVNGVVVEDQLELILSNICSQSFPEKKVNIKVTEDIQNSLEPTIYIFKLISAESKKETQRIQFLNFTKAQIISVVDQVNSLSKAG